MLILLAMGFLNRFRGGGYGAHILPGHPRFYVAPLVAGVAYTVDWDWIVAVAWGLCYLLWSFLPWGHLYCLGRTEHEPPRPISDLEEICRSAAKGNPWVAFGFLQAIGMIPTMLYMNMWAALAPLAIVAVYELAWEWSKDPIPKAEIATGIIWGLLING